jgi:hypothetical protein
MRIQASKLGLIPSTEIAHGLRLLAEEQRRAEERRRAREVRARSAALRRSARWAGLRGRLEAAVGLRPRSA